MGNRVGVISTRSTAGPLSVAPGPGPYLFVALLAARGPVNVPVFITSLDRFKSVFGGPTPYADKTEYAEGYEELKAYFAKRGRGAWVLRVVGENATTTVVPLDDRAGAPVNTLDVSGSGPGAYLEGYKIVIADGLEAGTFKLTLTDEVDQVVESFDNLKVDSASIERVNSQSDWLQLTDKASATAAPDNRPATGSTTIAVATHGGVNDNAPAAARIVGTVTDGVATGLKAFGDMTLGWGFFCAPDLDADATVKSEILEQTERYFRIPLSSTRVGASVADARTQRAELDAFNVAFYYPRVKVRDEHTQGIKAVSPAGWIAADWLNILDVKGLGKAPAGKDFKLDAGVLGLETQANGRPLIDDGVAEDLVARGINPIRDLDGAGAKVWGARAATSETAWRYIVAAFLWAKIGWETTRVLQTQVFENTDASFFSDIELGLYSYMADLHSRDAFRGELPAPREQADPAKHAFGVVCNDGLLSTADRDNNNVRAQIWYRPMGSAETIYTNIAKQNEV